MATLSLEQTPGGRTNIKDQGLTPHILASEGRVLVALHCRPSAYRLSNAEGVSGWYATAKDTPPLVRNSCTNFAAADTLDRFEVPFFGALASRFVDSE